MPDDSTTQLQGLIARMVVGDGSARDELVGRAYNRLRGLAHKLLQNFPRVRSFEDTGDVLHDALPRLFTALRAVPPPSVAEFFRLAARQIQWELKDLVERYYGAKGPGGKHEQIRERDGSGSTPPPGEEPSDTTNEPGKVAIWSEFHEQVEKLPNEEREVFGLLYYDGLTQAEAATILNVAEITVRRRWMAARLALQDYVLNEEPL